MSTARGFIGAGDIYLNRIDPVTNQPTGWVFGGDASKFSVKPNNEVKELESKGRDSYGQVIETVALQKPADLEITLREASKDNLTLAFMGSQSVINQSSGTATDEAVTLKAGYGSQLSKQNISATGIVLTSSPAGTTYVLGTDFTVNYRMGLLFAVEGSSLATAVAAAGAAGLPLLIDYTYNAISGTRVHGAVQPQLRCAVRFDGKNFADGLPVVVDVHEAILSPDAAFDFLADDWNEVTLKGRMKTPTGKTEPFTVDFRA